MIQGVRSVGIYVGDQDRAKTFYTAVLGFDLLLDTPLGESVRWIEVAPPDRRIVLVLFTPDDQRDRIGTFSNVIFECNDIQETYRALQAKGVAFAEPPSQQPWGWWASFTDPDGNAYGLTQRAA